MNFLHSVAFGISDMGKGKKDEAAYDDNCHFISFCVAGTCWMLRKRWFQVSPRSSWCRLQITACAVCKLAEDKHSHSKGFLYGFLCLVFRIFTSNSFKLGADVPSRFLISGGDWLGFGEFKYVFHSQIAVPFSQWERIVRYNCLNLSFRLL